MDLNIVEPEALVFRVLIREPWVVPERFCLLSSLPTTVSSPKLSVSQGNFRKLALTCWKVREWFFFLFLECPGVPLGRLTAALNARKAHSCSGLCGSQVFTCLISEEAWGPFYHLILGFSWTCELLETDTSACGNICIVITMLLNKLSDAS